MLHERGVLVLPDFIANAGGVICAAVEYHGGTQSQALHTIEEKIGANTSMVLAESAKTQTLPREAAVALAERRVRTPCVTVVDKRRRGASNRRNKERITVMRISQGQIVGLLLAATLLLSGCAATQIINQWSNPSYPTASFKRIMVIGVSKQPSIRRTFEDEFAAQLKAAGFDAVPGYEFIPEDGQAEAPRLALAVKQAGADAIITTRLVRVEKQADYIPGTYGPYPGFGFYRWYSSAWVGFYEPPRLRFYDIYISETSLYDVGNDRLVWSGIAKTTKIDDIRSEIRGFAEVVIAALREKNLLTMATSG